MKNSKKDVDLASLKVFQIVLKISKNFSKKL